MKSNEEKLERIEELLTQLQKNFQDTCQEIHTLIDSMDAESQWDEEADEDVDEELIERMDEIFGCDDEE